MWSSQCASEWIQIRPCSSGLLGLTHGVVLLELTERDGAPLIGDDPAGVALDDGLNVGAIRERDALSGHARSNKKGGDGGPQERNYALDHDVLALGGLYRRQSSRHQGLKNNE